MAPDPCAVSQAVVTPVRLVTCTVRTLEAHPSSPVVTKEGCVVLATLARSDTYRQVVMSNGGADVCLASLQAFPNAPDILDPALRVIVELSQAGAPQRRRLVEVGVVQALAAVMKAHASRPALLLHAVNALQLLVGECTKGMRMLRSVSSQVGHGYRAEDVALCACVRACLCAHAHTLSHTCTCVCACGHAVRCWVVRVGVLHLLCIR